MLTNLKAHLQRRKPKLTGDWVDRNSGYDADLAALLDMEQATGRYCDAQWREHSLEFKKGRSVWLDLVRYAEVQLGVEGARVKTATLFFIPNKEKPRERIDEIICVETHRLIQHLAITPQEAASLTKLAGRMKQSGRTLNAQASFKLAEARSIATFIID